MRVNRLASVAALLLANVCDAEPPRKPKLSHSDAWDYTFTGFAATSAVVGLVVPQSSEPHWTQPVLFDADVRR